KQMKKLAINLLVSSAPAIAVAQPAPPAPPVGGDHLPDPTDTIQKLQQQNDALDQKVTALGDQLAAKVQALQTELDQSRAEADKADKQRETEATKERSKRLVLPEWITGIEDRSDLRLRYDEIVAPTSDYTTRTRYRPRLRVGALVTLEDDFEI